VTGSTRPQEAGTSDHSVERLAVLAPRFVRYATEPDDSDELRLKKIIGVSMVLAALGLYFIYAPFYFALGEPGAGWVSLGGVACWILWLGSYGLFRRFEVHMNVGGVIAVSTLVAIHYFLGGYSQGMSIIWILTFPITSVITNNIRTGLVWSVIVTVVALVAALVDPYFAHPGNLSPTGLAALATVNLLGVGSYLLVIVIYFVWRISEDNKTVMQLLLNVFPRAVIPRLKAGENPIADGFPDVTVLFADIVGYTPLAERLGPRRTLVLLNDLFRRFDQAAERLGVEKIETVGDGYLAAAGALDARDDHPEAAAALAFAMLEAARQVQVPQAEHVQIRVGIHTGPVYGGVVGEHRFHYAIFGETVNLASRIQSQSQAGRILVSESTYKRICGSWKLEECAPLDLKGHGLMRAYWLHGPAGERHPTGVGKTQGSGGQ
jgi:adenylate cyclase